MHDPEQQPTAAMNRPTAVLLACVIAWVALATTYIALTMSHHPLPPAQINSLMIAALAVTTLVAERRRSIANSRTAAYMEGFELGIQAARSTGHRPRLTRDS